MPLLSPQTPTMKKATFSSRAPSPPFRLLLTMSLGIAMAGISPRADAVAVDSELILLVDIGQGGLNSQQFDTLMDSYASAMTSSQVLDSIQSGATGKIAVSLLFYGGTFSQTSVGVPWMAIGNMAQAQQFANLVQNVLRPFSISSPSISAALDYATNHFGTETGGPANGFESTAQILEVTVSSLPLFPNPSADKAARNDAIASGVDIINSIALGNRSSTISDYFASNVIGGEVGGVEATSTRSSVNNSLDDYLAGRLENTVEGGAVASQTAVPEPSSAAFAISAVLLLLGRRRRGESPTTGRA